MKKKLIYNPTYLILSLIAVNIISYFLFIRIDLTSNKKYSLSPVSKTMIKKIDKDISVTLFMSEGLTPDKIKLGREFRHLLKEYKTISNKAFTINTIVPNNSDKEALAEQLGIEPMAQEIAERDMVKIQKVYFGAVIQIGNQKETINILPTTALEYEVTRRLKEACDTTKPTIGFLRGHNEMLRQKTQLIEHELSHSAKIESMRIDQFTDLNDYKVICIVGPKESFSKEELVRLGQYLEQGGRLYIALNHAVGQISYSQNNGFINRVGIEDMLEEFGLDPDEGHIINGHVPVHQLEGENPVKCDGKVIVIDGGFCEAYRNVTGIAGYTLVYSSYGLSLTAHEPFTSAEDAVETERDIVSNRVAVRYNPRRALVGDTDNGKALKERIQELKQLLDAYRKGVIKEKK